MSKTGIELRDIVKVLPGGAKLFGGISLFIPRGQTVAIVGPSGSGKSTLLNIVSLVEKVDAGQLVLDGHSKTVDDVGALPLGYIFQRDALMPWANVMENVLLGTKCRAMPRAASQQRAREYLARFGLTGAERRFPDGLSGGQRQLVALAQNLIVEPEILLLDEPFAHLDFQSKLGLETDLIETIRQARRQRPMTTIIVTHDIEEAIVLADRVVVIGGFPKWPTYVLRDVPVEIADAQRDAVLVRESAAMPRYFREIWDAIRSIGEPVGGT